jgi:hypothetical protein
MQVQAFQRELCRFISEDLHVLKQICIRCSVLEFLNVKIDYAGRKLFENQEYLHLCSRLMSSKLSIFTG